MYGFDSLIAPGGTLFILGEDDVLLTTLEGGEATVPFGDFFALLPLLCAASLAKPSKTKPRPGPASSDTPPSKPPAVRGDEEPPD
jgi:hypothetical protein